VTEHSRADVARTYRLQVATSALAPGMSKELPVPSGTELRLARAGVLRLATEGDADVRCRVFDASGRLLAESADHGQDWNCALAEPLPAGTYRLDLESETLSAETTRVWVSMPQEKDEGVLTNRVYEPGRQGIVVSLPDAPQEGVIQEIDVRSPQPFSCALLDGEGTRVGRRSEATVCDLLLRRAALPGGRPYLLRLWALDGRPRLDARVALRPVENRAGEKVPAGTAARAVIEKPGRYLTSPQTFCLPESERGVLRPCGPEVSLDVGATVFSGFGPSPVIRLPLEETLLRADAPVTHRLPLAERPWLQRQTSSSPSIHLLSVEGLEGERFAPACSFGRGARVLRDTTCFAAVGPASSAVARVWSNSGPGEANVVHASMPSPSTSQPLPPGTHTLSWKEPSTRLTLPQAPFRAELLLPPGAWVVQTSDRDAIDLCPPQPGLNRCFLSGRGGSLFVSAPQPRLEATVLLGELPARAQVKDGLFETLPRVPGTLQLEVPSGEGARILEIAGAERCSIRLPDGTRIVGCSATLPSVMGAEVTLEHTGGPVRALAFRPGERDHVLFASTGVPTGELHEAQAVALHAAVDRTLVLERASIVHLTSDSGVCALLSAKGVELTEGMGSGCRIVRLLEAGAYRIRVRPFAALGLSGSLAWTATPIEELGEGVGAERWLAPGDADLYRFRLASAGNVGLGLQVPAETLRCEVLDASQRRVGEGCQQLLWLSSGTYLLRISAGPTVGSTSYRPVLVGLAGSQMDVPADYLRDFFSRIGGVP